MMNILERIAAKIAMDKVVITFALVAAACTLIPHEALAHGMSDADKQAISDGGNLQYLWIGATHMLSGYDHLLFVFGIIFFLSGFRDIVKYVSAFTIGHSVTLIYATFSAIQINYYFIDAIIGLSVCYIAFANIDGFRKYLSVNPPNMMAMIAGLGLIHGFGLSTRLQELPLSADHLLMNIIAFNIGVELGQVTALAFMLTLIAMWRKRHSFKAFSLIANYGLIVAGVLLFLMQMHDYSHDGEENAAFAAVPAQQAPVGAATGEAKPERLDQVSVTVPARGEVEYKVVMEQGAALRYAWSSGGTSLYFDFHGEPKGDTTGSFKSYRTGTESEENGALQAAFSGTHGWYWKNSANSPVTVRISLKGSYVLPPKKAAVEPAPAKEREEKAAHSSIF